jgi:hypothetical protein
MKENIQRVIREIKTVGPDVVALEEKEFSVIQELCGTNEKGDLIAMFSVLGTHGTILAIPALCAHLRLEDNEIKAMATLAIRMVKDRAMARGSSLPDVFFTPEHWRPEWLGSKNAFLSYVQVISDAYIKLGHDESEVNRIGEILAKEMNIDLAPYQNFADFKLCQASWDFKADYQTLYDRMQEEQAFIDLEEAGITESDVTFLKDNLMDLQYDYVVARLKLQGDLEFFRFVLKMAECLNHPAW